MAAIAFLIGSVVGVFVTLSVGLQSPLSFVEGYLLYSLTSVSTGALFLARFYLSSARFEATPSV